LRIQQKFIIFAAKLNFSTMAQSKLADIYYGLAIMSMVIGGSSWCFKQCKTNLPVPTDDSVLRFDGFVQRFQAQHHIETLDSLRQMFPWIAQAQVVRELSDESVMEVGNFQDYFTTRLPTDPIVHVVELNSHPKMNTITISENRLPTQLPVLGYNHNGLLDIGLIVAGLLMFIGAHTVFKKLIVK
jgi:hypothetical protein